MPKQPPNIILITTDHQRFDCIAAHGNPHIHTPRLDQLVNQGVSLPQCYANNPLCMPSRASIWTGRYPMNHTVSQNGIALPREIPNIAHCLKNAGYRTMNVGKLHFQPHFGPDRDHTKNREAYAGYGYDLYEMSDEPGCYDDAYIDWVRANAPQHLEALRVPQPTDSGRGHFSGWTLDAPEEFSHTAWVCRRGCELIEQQARADEPFFLSLGIYAPHPPLNPPAKYLELYDPEKLPLPEGFEAVEGKDAKAVHENIAYFYAMCSLIDHWVGHVMDCIDRLGLTENTLIVFMSDHGDGLGEYNIWNKGPISRESMLHIPCVWHWPGQLGGAAKERLTGSFAMVEAVDVLPTLLDVAGVTEQDWPMALDGKSAWPLLTGQTADHRDSVYSEHYDPRSGDSVRVVRTSEYKLIRRGDGREELHRCDRAVPEAVNLAEDPDYANALSDMRSLLITRMMAGDRKDVVRTHNY